MSSLSQSVKALTPASVLASFSLHPPPDCDVAALTPVALSECRVKQVVSSEHGLLTTVAYQLGSRQPACYALEV